MVRDQHPDCLVQTEWLAANLDHPKLRIFECTTHLRPAAPDEGVPYHPEAGRADYDQGHIPARAFSTCRASCRAGTRRSIS
jgi:3-mercaptopyruvate sulfurtransferase SseA